jgi:tetratricopeptide (TPR) repeat protein
VVRWSLQEGWQVASVKGETSPDGILAEVARCLRAAAAAGYGAGDPRRDLANELQRPEVDWEERFDLLSRQLLGELRLLVLLDNFEDNLAGEAPADPALPARLKSEQLAELLARWALNPGRSRLAITCRFRFELPRHAHRRLREIHLGPLSLAEARKLMWRLPGLDALEPAERRRAHEDVGGHPRALEYLDALLRGGQARFPDVAERMEVALEARGLPAPRAWARGLAGNVELAIVEAVSLAAGDVLLDRLLDRLQGVPLANQLLLGASVYREPVDEVGLAWQVAEVREDPPDPAREERLRKVTVAVAVAEARAGGKEASLETLGLSAAEIAQVREDFAAAGRPPLEIPAGFESARAALESLGLLAPVDLDASPDGLLAVHRWTASALASRGSEDDLRRAHAKAAAYWSWRVEVVPQSREQDLDQLLEARYHYRQAGDAEAAVKVTEAVGSQLHDWGAYRREEQLCLETLGWVAERSIVAAAFMHQLGLISESRGNYDQAVSWYRKSLEINEALGNRAGMAGSYHQLGMVAQRRGDYDQALSLYQKSLEINEEVGNRSGMASSYHQLGMVAEFRGDYDQALSWYQKSLEIEEELGNRAGMASSYHQLGIVAQHRGDYDQALSWYQKSLEIKEEIGERRGMAATISQIGVMLTETGSPEEALPRNLRSLAIRLEIGSPEITIDVYWLTRQQEALGAERFKSLLREHTGEEGAASVLALLDRAASDERDAGADGPPVPPVED